MSAGGRPTKLTPEVQQVICDSIRQGLPYKAASQLAGIHDTTRIEWRKRGERAKSGLYYEFANALSQAEAEAQQAMVAVVREAAQRGDEEVSITERLDKDGNVIEIVRVKRQNPRNWRAAMAMLERRHPEEFGRSIVQHEQGEGQPPIPVEVKMVFDDGEGQRDESEAGAHGPDAPKPSFAKRNS